MAVLDIIDAGAQDWFRRNPDKAKVREAYLEAYTRAVTALNAANHALAGTKNITQEEFDAAFAEFRKAFAELRQLLSTERLMVSGTMSVGQTSVVIPEPQALTYRVSR